MVANITVHDYDWGVFLPLEYYYDDGRHIKFDKYGIYIWGEVVNIKSGLVLEFENTSSSYHAVGLYHTKSKQLKVCIARAVLSTFYGKPRDTFTADHLDSANKNYDALYELQWASKKHQTANQHKKDVFRSAYIIVKDGVEKTAKEWGDYFDCPANTVSNRARKNTKGFSYKLYPDLPNEEWKQIQGSKSKTGYWEISNMNRCAYVSTFARNVIEVREMCLSSGYPVICVNNKKHYVHTLSFQTYYPDVWASKKDTDIVCHKFDNKLDFRPKNLYLGSASQNGYDAHDNGRFDGAKTERRQCKSYINGVFEKHHISLRDAEFYLRGNEYPRASYSNIGLALDWFKDGKKSARYGRTWVPV